MEQLRSLSLATCRSFASRLRRLARSSCRALRQIRAPRGWPDLCDEQARHTADRTFIHHPEPTMKIALRRALLSFAFLLSLPAAAHAGGVAGSPPSRYGTIKPSYAKALVAKAVSAELSTAGTRYKVSLSPGSGPVGAVNQKFTAKAIYSKADSRVMGPFKVVGRVNMLKSPKAPSGTARVKIAGPSFGPAPLI